ncbi:MAG: phosphate ABC transporter permease subunit PstC [Peptococcaceae bacterium]|nr:phosphate ABC transporter permease subunit PstC [Peptococcaceae bacterium]MDH7523794.1 phosphate ABC transporter permease subunit PstC [Peptococcaceae bacterium]
MLARKQRERVYETILFCSALAAAAVIILIAVFIFREGTPVFVKYGLGSVLFGVKWYPTGKVYGLWPMVTGSLCVTAGALVLGAPLAVLTAVFLAELAPQRAAAAVIRPAIDLLAGIPSVVYGLFGMTTVVPLIRTLSQNIPGCAGNPVLSTGYGILAGSIILAVMILPTIINVSADAIRCVPREYKEGSLALGATHWQTIYRVLLPAARPGILAGVVLGMGRAVGETMAIIMVAGNAPVVASSIFSSVRTLTGNIAIEMAYSSGEHTQALFAAGMALFVFIMMINTVALVFIKKEAG